MSATAEGQEADATAARAESESGPLTADMPADAALGCIVLECRKEIIAHRAAVLASDDSCGVHQIRVALRRLRAALALFGDVVADASELRFIDTEARRLADSFAPARDLQVFLSETAPGAPREIMRIGARLVDRRLARARIVLGSPRFAEFDRRLERFAAIRSEGGGENLGDFSRRILDRCEARVRRRGRGLAGLSVRKLHRLRLAAKRLRYAVGFLAPVFGSRRTEDYAEAAIGLQDALGRMNDRKMSGQVLGDIARAGRSSRGVRRSCKRLTRRLRRPSKRQRTALKHAWKTFKRSQPFWSREVA